MSGQTMHTPLRITSYDLEIMDNPDPVIVHIFPKGALEFGIDTLTEATAYCGHSWIPREQQRRATGVRPQEAMCDECVLHHNHQSNA